MRRGFALWFLIGMLALPGPARAQSDNPDTTEVTPADNPAAVVATPAPASGAPAEAGSVDPVDAGFAALPTPAPSAPPQIVLCTGQDQNPNCRLEN